MIAIAAGAVLTVAASHLRRTNLDTDETMRPDREQAVPAGRSSGSQR